MSKCLYCQRDSTETAADCDNCGMPLPTQAQVNEERRGQRFMWFCVGLAVFCGVMTVWLPRSIA